MIFRLKEIFEFNRSEPGLRAQACLSLSLDYILLDYRTIMPFTWILKCSS